MIKLQLEWPLSRLTTEGSNNEFNDVFQQNELSRVLI